MPTAQSMLVLALLATTPSTALAATPSVRAALPSDAASAARSDDANSGALRSGILLLAGVSLVGLALVSRRRSTVEAEAPRQPELPVVEKKSAPSATAAADWRRREALSDVS